MSLYAATPYEPTRYICLVGYDDWFDTFWTRVIDREALAPEDRDVPLEKLLYDNEYGDIWQEVYTPEKLVLNEGKTPDEILTPEELIGLIAPYATLPEGLRARLEPTSGGGNSSARGRLEYSHCSDGIPSRQRNTAT